MKKPNVKNNKLNEKVELKMKKKFDMEKIRKFVLERIYECLENDKVYMLSRLTTLAECSGLKFTKEELLFCDDIVELIEICDSIDFIKALFEAEGEDILDIEFEDVNYNLPFLRSRTMKELEKVARQLQRKITLTYIACKFPFVTRNTSDCLKWYLTQVSSNQLSMMYFIETMYFKAKEESVAVGTSRNIADTLVYDMKLDKANEFSCMCNEFELEIWMYYLCVLNGAYLEEHYPAEVQGFIDEVANGYIIKDDGYEDIPKQ